MEQQKDLDLEKENQQLKKQLAQERHFIHSLLDNMTQAITIFDAQGYFIDRNLAHSKMYGVAPNPSYSVLNDPIGKDVDNYEALEPAMKSGKVIRYPNMWYNVSVINPEYPNRNICLSTDFIPIMDQNGNLEKIVNIITDITEQKEAELHAKQIQKELNEKIVSRTLALENTESQFRRAYKRVSCFNGLFLHDINNIFSSFEKTLEMVRNKLESITPNFSTTITEINQKLDAVEIQLQRGNKIIHNIRNLAKIENSEMKLKPLSLWVYFQKALTFVRSAHLDKEIEVEYNDFRSFFVMANELITDVIENVLLNAVVHNSHTKVSINITALKIKKDEESYIQLKIADNGIGVSDSNKQSIFNSSEKVSEQKIKSQSIGTQGKTGLGIGLTNVAKLLDLLDGKIYVEDRVVGDPSQGAVFVIEFMEAT